jgi:hypothetical protein
MSIDKDEIDLKSLSMEYAEIFNKLIGIFVFVSKLIQRLSSK